MVELIPGDEMEHGGVLPLSHSQECVDPKDNPEPEDKSR